MSESIRNNYLTTWARTTEAAAARGLFGGKSISLRSAQIVNGPRAGALEIDAGLDAGAMLKALQASESALMRQLIPFEFFGEPGVFMSGRRIRLEAGWPSELAQDDIPLRALGQHPAGGGRWLVGRTERGSVLTAGLNDRTPHWLLAGTTGSGKTTALVSTIAQLSQDQDNRLVLIDAKHGVGLRPLANLPNMAGPLADDTYSAKLALGWCIGQMTERYSGARDDRRLIVCIDEIQEIVSDTVATECLRKLISQGRGANVHCLVATQHPVVDALGGPTIKRNLGGRLALRVTDYDASKVAVGAPTPRADRLLGRGDSYTVTPGATHRVQVAYLDTEPDRADPELDEWPDLGDLPDNSGWPSPAEIGASIVCASRNHEGRTRYVRQLTEAGEPGMSPERAQKLIYLGRDTLDWMSGQGYSVRPSVEIQRLYEKCAQVGQNECVVSTERTHKEDDCQ